MVEFSSWLGWITMIEFESDPMLIHFRGYPSNVLIPCEGEDSVKWNFVNSFKEAAYMINGNCKNVMNMSQSDQEEKGNALRYATPSKVSSRSTLETKLKRVEKKVKKESWMHQMARRRRGEKSKW